MNGRTTVGARTPGGVGLFAVDGTAPGLTRTPVPTLDQTRKQAHLEFTGTPARLIGDEAGGWRVRRDEGPVRAADRLVPGSSRHHGLLLLLVPARQPGVQVRPITTMLGDGEFCEVRDSGKRREEQMALSRWGKP